MNALLIWFALAKGPTPPASPPPVYVPICVPGHPKCARPYPPITHVVVRRPVMFRYERERR